VKVHIVKTSAGGQPTKVVRNWNRGANVNLELRRRAMIGMRIETSATLTFAARGAVGLRNSDSRAALFTAAHHCGEGTITISDRNKTVFRITVSIA
jgi:hypothetical protein